MDGKQTLHALGRRVRAQRKHIGLSQEQLALVAGVDRSYFGAIERGERNVTFTVLCRLSIALQCDVGTLTSGLPLQSEYDALMR